MYESFTQHARKVVQLANQEAQLFNHEHVGTEHILLGMVNGGTGVAAAVLASFGVDLKTTRAEVQRIVPSTSDMVATGRLPHSPRTAQLIQYAAEESRNFHHDHVGTEHLLLGLLRVQDGVAVDVLVNLSLDLAQIHDAVVHFVEHGVAPQPRRTAVVASLTPQVQVAVGSGRVQIEPLPLRSWKIVHCAEQEAKTLKHEYVGTEHILLWLVKEAGGVAGSALNTCGVDADAVRQQAARIGQPGSAMDVRRRRPLTLRAEEAIAYAFEEARKFDHHYLGPEHFLLGLLRQDEGAAAKILTNLNLQREAIREEVLRLMGW